LDRVRSWTAAKLFVIIPNSKARAQIFVENGNKRTWRQFPGIFKGDHGGQFCHFVSSFKGHVEQATSWESAREHETIATPRLSASYLATISQVIGAAVFG
jgi:hypothetical protein